MQLSQLEVISFNTTLFQKLANLELNTVLSTDIQFKKIISIFLILVILYLSLKIGLNVKYSTYCNWSIFNLF